MAETIETKIISIKDAKNGNFDIALKNFPQAEPEEGVVQMRANVIQIRNARNGDFDLVIPEDHTIEDALVQNTPMDEYVNDRITNVIPYSFFRTNFKKIIFPNVTFCDRYAFYGGTNNEGSVEEIYMPKWETGGSVGIFSRQPKLRVIDYGFYLGINGRVAYCAMLNTLIFRNATTVTDPNSTCFEGTPFAPDGTGGYVYVPQNLLGQYQNSTSWQQYANVLEFRPIEGSEYEIIE